MTDYYLKFTDEAQAISVLTDFRNDDTWVQSNQIGSCDVIGTIYKGSGVFETDSEGFQTESLIPVEGFHVNLRLNNPTNQYDDYLFTPVTPKRVWG